MQPRSQTLMLWTLKKNGDWKEKCYVHHHGEGACVLVPLSSSDMSPTLRENCTACSHPGAWLVVGVSAEVPFLLFCLGDYPPILSNRLFYHHPGMCKNNELRCCKMHIQVVGIVSSLFGQRFLHAGYSHVEGPGLFGFQNCIIRPSFFVLLLRAALLSASSNVSSVESLLRSPWELLMSRLRLMRLDRRRPNAAEETETGR